MKSINRVYCLLVLLFIVSSCTSNSSQSGTDVKSANTTPAADSAKVAASKITKSEAARPDITGTYKAVPLSDGDMGACNLLLTITKQNGQYMYRFAVKDSVMKGKVTLSKSEDLQQAKLYITLEGISWVSYEGDISQEDDEHPAEPLEIPVGITMGYLNRELTFQNYGNAMNSYTVLDGCDQKFVRLVKQ